MRWSAVWDPKRKATRAERRPTARTVHLNLPSFVVEPDLFCYNDGGPIPEWFIIDVVTGLSVGYGRTLKEAREHAEENLTVRGEQVFHKIQASTRRKRLFRALKGEIKKIKEE